MRFPTVVLSFFLLFPVFILAQTGEDEQAITNLLQRLFDGMRTSDTADMRSLLLPDARLQSVSRDQDGETVIREGSMEGWLRSVGTPHEKILDERIYHLDIRIDGPFASAWMDYAFYLGDDLHHCGINAFQLVKQEGAWKVFQVTDTRRTDNCFTDPDQPAGEVNARLDQWHRAAATADADAFFGAMTEDAIYLGTDASERWLRDELRSWAKDAFEKEVAWAFTPSDRELYFTSDGQTAWFEEKLATWMGPARGSGVLQKIDGDWKIRHYNLALTVPNEKIEAFKELVGAED